MHLSENYHRILTGLILFTFISTIPVFAAGPLYKQSKVAKRTHKLLRGTINIPFCWVEIPLEINKEVRNLDPFTGTITGVAKGTCKSVKRLGFSIWEVATFWTGDNEQYKKVTKSEFPMMDVVE